jgi:hypothetical protein
MKGQHSSFWHRTQSTLLIGMASVIAVAATAFQTARAADTGAGLRIGTLGAGVDFDIALIDRVNLRVGYSAYNIHRNVEQTDVTYDGKVKLSNPAVTLDWFPLEDSGFRASLGAVGSGTRVDATGMPNSSAQYVINGVTYTAAQLTSLNGRFRFGNTVSPYMGIGWGNPVKSSQKLTFLFDVGVVYGGTPDVTLNANCASTVPTTICSQLAQDIEAERQKLVDQLTTIKWYPVISLGMGYRF